MKKNGSYNLIITILILAIIGVIFFIFYTPLNTSYTFTLEKDEIVVYQGTRVVSNYTALDSDGNNINNEVTIDDKVDINVPGEYQRCFTINHKEKKETKCQKIIVKEKIESKYIIKLNGEDKIFVLKDHEYKDEGAKVYSDNTEVKVVINKKGTVNSSVPGDYTITYYFDINGIHKEIERKVVVYDIDTKISLSPETPTSGKVVINISTNSDYYQNMMLPSGNKTQDKNVAYEVTKNGDYKFIIYDKYGNYISKVVTVSNIKRNYSCNGVINYKGTTLTVSGDNDSLNYIKSYIYNLDGVDYGGNKSYTIFKVINKGTVKLKLKDDTEEKVSCNIENKLVYNFKYDKDNTKPYMKCDSYTASDKVKYEKQLADAIKQVGYGTRAGVVEAARFLTGGLEYKVRYLGPKKVNSALGRYNRVGLNIGQQGAWGCSVSGWTQGMDCTNFVEWAFKQNGLDIKGGCYGTSNTYKTVDVKDKIRAGDFLLVPNRGENPNKGGFLHIGIVVGVNSNSIYVAEATTGSIDAIVITRLDKESIGSSRFSIVRLYDYPSDGNYTDMWLE